MKPYRLTSLLALCLAGLGLLACTYSGAANDPVARRLTYFSFLAADDLRADCAASTAERYRFVYNGEYSRQVRIYEVLIDPSTREGRLEVRVLGPRHYGAFQFGFQNWLLEQAVHRAALGPANVGAVRAALEQAQFGQLPAHRLELWSDSYYWLVSTCTAGVFHQNGWLHPSARYDALRFAEVLATHDGTGIAFVTPPPGDPRPSARRFRPRVAQASDEGGVFMYAIEPAGP